MPRRPRVLVPLLAMALALTAGAAPTGVSASAAVDASIAAGILALVNDARADLGLVPLRLDAQLRDLARKRATAIRDAGRLSHVSYGGEIGPAVTSTGLPWLLAGEAVGRTWHADPATTPRLLLELWRGSAPHWVLIASRDFNYIGVGATRTADGVTYAALVFAETPDRTAPSATRPTGSLAGGRFAWRWSAADMALQTHTAGICSYDVQLRSGTSSWHTVRSRSAGRSYSMAAPTNGEWRALRVRARDCAGNVSGWTAATTIRRP